jgi:hypothetical protein
MRAAFQLYPTEAIGYRRLLYADPPRKRWFREKFRRELPCTLPCTGNDPPEGEGPVYSSPNRRAPH